MDPTPRADERELQDLRARAYGPDADIQDDPAALARLAELESTRARERSAAVSTGGQLRGADAASGDAAGTSEVEADGKGDAASSPVPRRRGSTRPAHVWLAACAGVAIVAAACGIIWLLGPHPDATLAQIGTEPDDQIQDLIQDDAARLQIDRSTLQSYETFRGVEPFSAVDVYGNPCLLVVERSTESTLDAICTPRGSELVSYIGAWPALHRTFAEGLPDGSAIGFHLRGDSVHAFIHRAPANG